MSAPPLFKHQKASLKFLSSHDLVFDMSDPGTGKTRVHLEDYARQGRKKALVLAPKSLLVTAWQLDAYSYCPELKVSVAYAENRWPAFKASADLYVTNHDAVNWLLENREVLKDFDTLIVDESPAYKHHTSKRSKAIAKLRDNFKIVRALTGTPTTLSITDIWHQAFLLDKGRRLGRSFFHFRSSVCTPVQVGRQAHMIRWEDRPGAEEAVMALLKDITIRHIFEECTDIPPNHEYMRAFLMNPRHEKIYRKLEKDTIILLGQKEVSAINGAVLYGKLMQVASGAVYSSENDYALVDKDRYELVADLIEERAHSVCFFNWRHQRDQMVLIAEHRGFSFAVIDGETSVKERARIVQDFQKGHYKVLFAHPQSAGHGLTLTRATSTIWCSPTHNLEHYLQANRRIYRIGQKERTETIVVIARDTVDETVFAACQRKSVKLGNLLSALGE